MITIDLFVCAESVIVDKATNHVSVINLFESSSAQSFPLAIAKFSTLITLNKEEEDSESLEGFLKFALAGSEIARVPVSIHFQGKNRTRSITILQGFILPGPGILKASLIIDESEIGSWKARFSRTGEQQPELIPSSSDS